MHARHYFLGLAAACVPTALALAQNAPQIPPDYGPAFRSVWHDGNAELASYDLIYPRYGELRSGTAVAITVTEPFNPERRVKSNRGGAGTHGVVKLNLVEDYQTGVYDYNQMTSVFVATEPAHGLPAGSPTKVSFSCQEWCGHVYQQALFSRPNARTPGVRQTLHSYFETEADQNNAMDHPAGGLAEDALFLWARGLAGPRLAPGQSIEIPVYRSMALQRLRHVRAEWETATLRVGKEPVDTQVPAGTFSCLVYTADFGHAQSARTAHFFVDQNPDGHRRVVRVERGDGYAMQLRAAERRPYWSLHGNRDEATLKEIGLERRPPGSM